MKPTRRQVGAASIGSVIGLGAVVSIGTDTTAAEVTGEFTIPEIDKEIQDPVNSVSMDVEGSCSWDADTLPSMVVLRLEAARDSTDYEQLDSKMFQSDLSAVQEQEFTFSDVNLLDHSSISAVNFSPTEVDSTKSLTLHTKLTMEVRHDGQVTAQANVEESTPVEITKTRGGVTIEMGATGEISIGTTD